MSVWKKLRFAFHEPDGSMIDFCPDDVPEDCSAITYAQLDFSLYAMRDFCILPTEREEDSSEALGELRERLGIG